LINILQEIAAHKRSEVAQLKTELTLSEIENQLETDDRLDFGARLGFFVERGAFFGRRAGHREEDRDQGKENRHGFDSGSLPNPGQGH